MNGDQTKIITLNVGGRVFSTTLTTLLSHPDSVLARMFSNDGSAVMPPAMTDSSGHYFIDRDPDAFAVILNYLRFVPRKTCVVIPVIYWCSKRPPL